MNEEQYNKFAAEARRYVAHERVGYVMYKDMVEPMLVRAFIAGGEMMRLECFKIANRGDFLPQGQEIAALIKKVWLDGI